MKIEKNIPIPKLNRGRKNSPLRKALMIMEVGDSLLFTKKQQPTIVKVSKEHNIKFTVRQVSEGYRVWRIK